MLKGVLTQYGDDSARLDPTSTPSGSPFTRPLILLRLDGTLVQLMTSMSGCDLDNDASLDQIVVPYLVRLEVSSFHIVRQ